MFILINSGILIGFGIAFAISFFIIERSLVTNISLSKRLPRLIIESIEVLVYSGIFVVAQIVGRFLFKGFQVPLFVIGAMILLSIRNVNISVFSLAIPLIYFLLAFPIENPLFVTMWGMFFVMFLFEIFEFTLSKMLARVLMFWITAFTGLLCWLIASYFLGYQDARMVSSYTLFVFLGSVIIEQFALIAIRVSISANILYESVNYDFATFARVAFKETVIGDAIKTSRFEHAVYGIFKFAFEDQGTPENNIEIQESILLDIEKVFPPASILFKADEKHYGFFLPHQFKNKLRFSQQNNRLENRPVDDPLLYIQNLVAKISRTYLTTYHQEVRVDAFAGVSIYGAQDNSLERLNTFANFALTVSIKGSNRINLFDPMTFIKKNKDAHNLLALDKTIKLDKFANDFTPIFNIKEQTTQFNIVKQQNVSEDELIASVREHIHNVGANETFERYFAADALNRFKTPPAFKTIFNYSISALCNNFDPYEFLRQLNSSQIKSDSFVFNFSLTETNIKKSFAKSKEMIKILKETGIEIAISNYSDKHKSFVNKLKPDYVIIKPDFFKKDNFESMLEYLGAERIIVENLRKEDDVLLAIKNNLNLVGGELFSRNSFPSEFDKESQDYLKEILERRDL